MRFALTPGDTQQGNHHQKGKHQPDYMKCAKGRGNFHCCA